MRCSRLVPVCHPRYWHLRGRLSLLILEGEEPWRARILDILDILVVVYDVPFATNIWWQNRIQNDVRTPRLEF